MLKWILILGIFGVSTGCHLIPKQVEFGQDKVERFPVAKGSEQEVQRQVAQRAAEKSEETLRAALLEESSAAVVQPAKEASRLSDSVSRSLGPPEEPAPIGVKSDALAQKLDHAVAKLNARIDGFRRSNDENVGKKIEDTGVFKIGYFSMWLVIGGIVFLLWGALKVYGMVNPVVGLGTNIVGRVSSSVVHRALGEVAEGGEKFKELLKKSGVTDEVKSRVMQIFQEAHERKQSRDVQTLVQRMTENSN